MGELVLRRLTRRQVVATCEEVLRMTRHLDVCDRNTYIKLYCARDPITGAWEEFVVPDDPKKLQEAIPKIVRQCTVCARGALLLGAIGLYDRVGGRNVTLLVPHLTATLFGSKQATAIEDAFEQPEHVGRPDLAKLEAKPRLRKILREMIRDGGTFKNEPRPKRRLM